MISAIDFEYQKNVYSTDELKDIFNEKQRMDNWLKVESALAIAQSESGIIPRSSGEFIQSHASIELLNLENIKQEYTKNNNTLIPVLKELKRVCGEHGEFVHYGATTQDILDTGQSLQIKQFLSVLSRDLDDLHSTLYGLVDKYKDLPMIGRSHGQHATPITYGLKLSVWLAEVKRNIVRVSHLKENILTGQLFGASGNMAALGDQAFTIHEKVMERLGLKMSLTPWHSSRDNIAELASVLSIVASTNEKIANEIFYLCRSDVGELTEVPVGQSGSSTMPHKCNPVISERIVVSGRLARGIHAIIMNSTVHENERDPRNLWAEWVSVPQLCIYSGVSCHYLKLLMNNLRVNEQVMKENLCKFGELVITERILFKLSQSFGRNKAKQILDSYMEKRQVSGISLFESIQNDSDVGQYHDINEWDFINEPETYIGKSIEICNRILNS